MRSDADPAGGACVLRAFSPRGGGWGEPTLRTIERVALDVKNGVGTREQAREVYGVMSDENLPVDPSATDALHLVFRA